MTQSENTYYIMPAQRHRPSLRVMTMLLFGHPMIVFGWIFGGFASFFLYMFPAIVLDSEAIFALIPLAFMAFGLAFIAFGLRIGLQGMRLLWHGWLTQGQLVEVMDTGVRQGQEGNMKPMWQLTYRFIGPDGQTYQIYGTTLDLSAEELAFAVAAHRLKTGEEVQEPEELMLEDEELKKQNFKDMLFRKKPHVVSPDDVPQPTDLPEAKAPVFFNPERPTDAAALSCLPGRMSLNFRGAIECRNPWWALLPPVLVIGIHFGIHHPDLVQQVYQQLRGVNW